MTAVAANDWPYCPQIKTRWPEFERLLDQIARDHKIGDLAELSRAVDTAARFYHEKPLPKGDAAALKKAIPVVVKALSGNTTEIANILMKRGDLFVRGGAYDYGRNVAILTRMWEVTAALSAVEKSLKSPRRSADTRLHGATAVLERCWADLTGRSVKKTFTPKDRRAGRRLAKSEAMKFVETILNFIDPEALSKLPSAVRHRLK